jgi:TRAP-type C4-dicarboxylate transport system permease small subunit
MPQTHTEQAPRPRSWPRRLLDGLYLSAGVAAAASMVIILLIILAQMACRALGIAFPGSTDYAGYFMAQTSFLAFAHALNRGAHIRVGVLLNALGRHRRWAEIWCLAIGSLLGIWFAWHAAAAVRVSRMLGDVSQGQDATPLWIPQLGMAIGSAIFAIALLDHLFRAIRYGDPGIGDASTE